jgi:hypothetical protein
VTASRSVLVTLAIGAGLLTGWVLSRRYLERYRAALFSAGPRRRHAALGYLAGHSGPETLGLLRDYLAWERHPVLRRRAVRVLRELELAAG